MTGLLLLVVLAAIGVAIFVSRRRAQERALEKARAEMEPVKKFAFEDITALGVQLQSLDADMAGHDLNEGANADYQRALDAYESAKRAGDAIKVPEDLKHVAEIVEDGRYAILCVRARVSGEPLPARRLPCFFDPRHGPSIEDVPYTPPGGALRDVPACALDAERVHAGAEPDIRKVMVGSQRVPYWQGGRAYQPYATGYFGIGAMDMMFMGLMFGGFGGFGALGDGLGALGDGVGDLVGGVGDGIGDLFDGFDF